jgi:hypothetical protein
VIERSFASWLTAWQLPDTGEAGERFIAMAVQTAKALLGAPDFIKLGLMLALERRPEEPRARTVFLQVRAEAYQQVVENFRNLTPRLSEAGVHQLATYAIAGADGLFVAKEIGGDAVDLIALFEMHGRAIHDIAQRMIAE